MKKFPASVSAGKLIDKGVSGIVKKNSGPAAPERKIPIAVFQGKSALVTG